MKRGDAVTLDNHPATVAAVTSTHIYLVMDDGCELAIRKADAFDRIKQQGVLVGWPARM